MTIVQINGSYGEADSTGRTCMEMHNYFKENSIDSYVFTACINDANQYENDIVEYSNIAVRKVHSVLSRMTGLQGYFSKGATRKLLAQIEDIKPDAVILRVLHNNSMCFPLLFKYLACRDIPTLLILHDCWYYTGHCCYYTEVDCEKWKTDCNKCVQKKQWNKSWLFDTAKRCLTDKSSWYHAIRKLGVVGVSDWITDEARQSVLRDAKVIERIYNWIDLSVFRPQDTKELRIKYGFQEQDTVLIAVASGWCDQKGFQEILYIAKQHPHWNICLIGNVLPDQVKMLPGNIRKIGSVKSAQVLAEYYSMADIFVNPSVQETFGKTTAEALCCGTPAVVYRTTACTELVPKQCGEAAEYGNKNAYIDAVDTVAKRGKKYYSKACVNFARENFDMSCNIKKYFSIIEELINGKV